MNMKNDSFPAVCATVRTFSQFNMNYFLNVGFRNFERVCVFFVRSSEFITQKSFIFNNISYSVR